MTEWLDRSHTVLYILEKDREWLENLGADGDEKVEVYREARTDKAGEDKRGQESFSFVKRMITILNLTDCFNPLLKHFIWNSLNVI